MSRDPDTRRGTSRAVRKALGAPLLIDADADRHFASMIDRLRTEPGSNLGGKQ